MARTELRDAAAVLVVGSDDQSQAAGRTVDHDQFVELTVYAAPVVQRAIAQSLEAISACGGPYQRMDVPLQGHLQRLGQLAILTVPHATLTEQRPDEPALLREAAGTHL